MKSAPVIIRSSACAAPDIHAGVREPILGWVILDSPVQVCYPIGLTPGPIRNSRNKARLLSQLKGIACSITEMLHIKWLAAERRALMRLYTFLIGTSSTILFIACSGPDGMGPRVTKLQQALTQAKVSLRQSVETGEASVTGGKAVKAALLVDAAPEYSVRALGGGTLHDVRLDIVTGSVTTSNIVGASADPCPGSIPVADAIAIAEARVNGHSVSVQPDDDDQCLREVQVLAGDVLWEVKLARTGAVLEVEKSDADGE
jgi:hypothetical protein